MLICSGCLMLVQRLFAYTTGQRSEFTMHMLGWHMQPQRASFIMSGWNPICNYSPQTKRIDPFGSWKPLSIEKETSRQREQPSLFLDNPFHLAGGGFIRVPCVLPSLKQTARPWTWSIPKRKLASQAPMFSGQTVSFREGYDIYGWTCIAGVGSSK